MRLRSMEASSAPPRFVGMGGDMSSFEYSDGALPADHPMSWTSIAKNPKSYISTKMRVHKTINYHILHTGGFVRLCTSRGRAYWLAQNARDHRTPDWKLHFSVLHEEIPRAWNIVAACFLDFGCEFGMKATVTSKDQWSKRQYGRELTVYIFRHVLEYTDGNWIGNDLPSSVEAGQEDTEVELQQDFYLGVEYERSWENFWVFFIDEVENRMLAAGLKGRGFIANGDLALPNCHYASLRNEAYVRARQDNDSNQSAVCTTTFMYPPNSTGWNAAKHPPINA